MAEQIGINSEVNRVKSEIDRVDAIFTVATGSMGYQEINYHLIDEDRDRSSVRQSHTFRQSIDESPKEKSSLKSRSSPVQSRHTIELIDSKVLNTSPENGNYCNFLRKNDKIFFVLVAKKEIELKLPDDENRKVRFSLPEIDSSNQQEKKYPIKKGIKTSLKTIFIQIF
jgi:hypothetical protein